VSATEIRHPGLGQSKFMELNNLTLPTHRFSVHSLTGALCLTLSTRAKMKATIIVALSSAVLGLLVARVAGIQSPYLIVVCILGTHITIRRFLTVNALRPGRFFA
jgi:hypothetical protein